MPNKILIEKSILFPTCLVQPAHSAVSEESMLQELGESLFEDVLSFLLWFQVCPAAVHSRTTGTSEQLHLGFKTLSGS